MLLTPLRRILPRFELFTDAATRQRFAGDKWFASHAPDAVALPRSTASVAKLLAFAHAQRIPITPRGAGYGYVGSCVPNKGGIVLSLERMDRIKEISADDFVAVRQPGRLYAGRQHRHQRRRPAMPQIRRHARLRARPGSRPGRRHGRSSRRTR